MIFSIGNIRSIQVFEIKVTYLFALWIESKCLTEERLCVDCRLAVGILLEASHYSIKLIQRLSVGWSQLVQ